MRGNLSRLKKVMQSASERTAKVAADNERKRAEKKAMRPATSKDVEHWFREGLRALRGSDHVVGRWTAKERKLAVNLLEDYGAVLTAQAVAHLCARWPEYVRKSRGGLSGDPSIALLWGMRNRVFGEVQASENAASTPQEDPKNRDEFSDDGNGGVGW